MNSSGLSGIYFHYIDMDERLFKNLSIFFERIGLLQPSFWRPSEWAERLKDAGIVDIEAPLQIDLNNAQVRRMIREFESLIAIYQDSGYLEYMKIGHLPFEDDHRCHRIIHEIKQYGGRLETRNELKSRDHLDPVRGQLLLYLAQELERQRQEILSLSREVAEQEEGLKAILRMDYELLEEEEEPYHESNRNVVEGTKPEEDDLLIPQRLRAWNEMYRLVDSRGMLVFTDNPLVARYLIEESSKIDEREGNPFKAMGIEEVLRFSLPCFSSGTIEECLKARASVRELPEWQAFEKELIEFLLYLERSPWEKGIKKVIISRGHGMSMYVLETLVDKVIDRIHRSSSLIVNPSLSSVFKFYIIPGKGLREFMDGLFQSSGTVQEGEKENGIILLVQKEESRQRDT